MRKSNSRFNKILLIVAIQTLCISCSQLVLTFLDTFCHLNQQIESLQRQLLLQQQSFIEDYERLLAPSLFRNRNTEDQNISNNSYQQQSEQLQVVNSFHQMKNSSLCQDAQCINDMSQSRRILQDKNLDQQGANQQPKTNNEADVQKKKIVNNDKDDKYVQTFLLYQSDPFIYHVYMKEQIHIEYNLGTSNQNEPYDIEYQVPRNKIYYTEQEQKTYKVIKLFQDCPSHSQKVIQQRYIYYCDDKRVFIQNYIQFKKDQISCYKKQVYMEACLCPKDKYGTFCSDEVPITCNIHNQNSQEETQKMQNTQKIIQKTLGVYYGKVGALKSQGFNINLKCSNQRAFVDILNNRFETIDGLCSEQLNNQTNCFIQKFDYRYFDSKSEQLKITDDIQLYFVLELTNLKRMSQPLLLNYTFQEINSDMLLGKTSFNIPLNIKDISNFFPQFKTSDFLQYGKMWYSLRAIGKFQQSNFTEYEMNLGYWNGVLVEEDYIEPKLNYYQLLTINKWDILDYAFVFLTLFLLLVVCLILLYLINSLKKIFANCTEYSQQLKHKLLKTEQKSQINSQQDQYSEFNDV